MNFRRGCDDVPLTVSMLGYECNLRGIWQLIFQALAELLMTGSILIWLQTSKTRHLIL